MPYITKYGCCNEGLRSTVYIVGCMFILWNMVFGTICAMSTDYVLLYLEPLLYFVISVLLCMGVIFEKKWLILPWFLVLAVTISMPLRVVFCIYINHDCFDLGDILATYLYLGYYCCRLILELIFFRYVLSYYLIIGQEGNDVVRSPTA